MLHSGLLFAKFKHKLVIASIVNIGKSSLIYYSKNFGFIQSFQILQMLSLIKKNYILILLFEIGKKIDIKKLLFMIFINNIIC